MSIREQALKAKSLADNEAREAARQEEEIRYERDMIDYYISEINAYELLRQSPLVEWFPDSEWEWYGSQFGSEGYPVIFVSERESGTNPIWQGIPIFRIREVNKDIIVEVVIEEYNNGYSYWTGSIVKSIADIGHCIETIVDPARDKLRNR